MEKKKVRKTSKVISIKGRMKKAVVKTKTRDRHDSTLYVYVSPTNRHFALEAGKKKYGSASKYIGHLIARDRGVKTRISKVKQAA